MKSLLTFLLFSLTTFSLSSQNLSLSGKGGIVANKFQISNDIHGIDESTDWGQGYKVGVFLNTNSGEAFDIESGLEFAIYGIVQNSSKSSVLYLQTPLLGQLNISDNFKLLAGPSFGMRLNDQNLQRFKIDAVGALEFDVLKTTIRLSGSYSINNIAPWEIYDFTTREVIGTTTGRLLEISIGFVYRAGQ